MRRLSLALCAFGFAAGVVGCSGGNTTPSGGVSPTSATANTIQADLGRPKFLRFMRIPNHPPPHKHRITAAMRARARKGGWQPLASVPSFMNGPQTALVLTDGSVIVQDYCTPNWYRLVPDQNGNYVTGTWSETAPMQSTYAPLYNASAVLADGKLISNGGEYNGSACKPVETNLGAIYDPVANTWAPVTGPSGWSRIGDAQSVVLGNGTYMLGNCCTSAQALLNEASLSWTIIGSGKQDSNSEEGWTLLRNGNVLEVNVSDPPYAQAYSPSASMWESAGQLPVNLVTGLEIGPQTLRPNGTVFVAGATGDTAIYNEKTGNWTQGPTFPVVASSQLDVADGPSTVLTDGTVMIPASPGLYQSPTYFYIFNGKKLKSIPAPPDAPNDSTFNIRLLMLPNGQVLEDDGSTDMEVYTASTKVETNDAPRITSVPTTLSPGSTYQISGKLFNGVTQANMYGDDVQEATNYPLVRITNNTSGHVVYARTHNHSFMGVASNKTVSTMFDVPSTIETGASALVVVANGIASRPVSVTIQ
jgi:hypothetical protein